MMKNITINRLVLRSLGSIPSRSVIIDSAQIKQPLKSFKDIPGPSSLPIIGLSHLFFPGGPFNNENGYALCAYLYKKYGTLVKLDGTFRAPPVIFVFDPEMIAQSENWLPVRMGLDTLEYFRKKHNKKEYDVLSERSTGLLTEQGEKWKSFRSAVNPVLMQPKIIRLYEKPIDEVAQEMIIRMRSLRNNKGIISEPFDVEMNKWALESIGVVALGGRIGCLRADLPPDAPATRLIHCVHEIFKVLHELDFRPSPWRLFTTPTFTKAMKVFQELVDLTRYFIHDAMKKLNDEKYTRTEEQKGVLEKLLEVDEDIAVKMATDMLFAGVDTTAHSMISVLYLLAANPEKQMRLREEILAQNERKQYLKACIKEAMRVQPTAFANLRMSTKEYNLNGYLIPKGVNCLLPHEFISKQEAQYERATEFIPERWTERSEETKARAHAYATMPFGFGVRMCVGRRIAELELETLLSRIIENFHVEWFGPPLKQKTITVTYMVGPYNFIFRDVK